MRQVYTLDDYVKEEFETPVRISFSCNKWHRQSYFHWHPHIEITVIFSGSYVIENSMTRIDENRPGIFIHAPYSLHRANTDGITTYRRNTVAIRRDVMSLLPSELLDMSVFSGVNLAYAFPNGVEIDEIERNCLMMNDHTEDRAYSALYSALIIKKTLDIINSGRGELISSRVTYMQDVLHFVASNLAKPLTLEELAAQYGIGKSKLNLDFKTATGSTYKKYLTDLRMTRALELLQSGSSIINTSFETGYSSEAHFIATYRSYWGVTPGESLKVRSNSEK